MNVREMKGQDIASRSRITQQDGAWLVPSQSSGVKYTVSYDADAPRCTCPDFEIRRMKCKHIFAVEFTIERQRTTVTETKADGSTTTTVTDTVKVTKKTYRQEWPAYNAAQTQEKEQFLRLLFELCKGVGSPAQVMGRPRFSLEDMIFAMCFKVYSTVSGRRFMSDLREAHGKGYLEKLPCYNSVFNYFESEMLTPYLKMLIEESSLPLQAIEEDFAVDSTGLSTGSRLKWHDTKWGKVHVEFGDTPRRIERKDWVKVHVCTGVRTNVITAVEITDSHAGDSPQFPKLVDDTAQNFAIRQVSADKAYSSNKNLHAVVKNQGMPYIAFKSTATGKSPESSSLWKRMYHFYAYNQERFLENYHKRSNVETTFSMIKAKFGDALRSKTKTAQINEALCKVLCHNIVVLIQSMFELGIEPTFWDEATA